MLELLAYSWHSKIQEPQTKCGICLDEFNPINQFYYGTEPVLMLKCGHLFHANCLWKQWDAQNPSHYNGALINCGKCFCKFAYDTETFLYDPNYVQNNYLKIKMFNYKPINFGTMAIHIGRNIINTVRYSYFW